MANFRTAVLEIRDLAFGVRGLPDRLLRRLKRAQSCPTVEVREAPSFPSGVRLKTLAEFNEFYASHAGLLAEIKAFEASLVPPADLFAIVGYCVACARQTSFLVDYRFSDEETPNWRERLICVRCKLSNRVRGMLDFLDSTLHLPDSASVYVTEQSTPFFRALARRYRDVVGSEFVGRTRRRGSLDLFRIRNEDITQLTFSDGSFDAICASDVLEHVPDYERALRECYRCLRPGGRIVISVPFLLGSHETLVRARVGADGAVEHLSPAEYHGDPLRGAGTLCYYHFGWDFLDSLAEAGFASANLHFYWDAERGYLGGLPFVISAVKPGASASPRV